MEYVFISYLRDDQPVVDRLVAELRRRDVNVWLDRDEIMPGQRWKDAIRRAITGGAHFLACFSSAYQRHDRTYLNEELTLAIEQLRQRPVDCTWFIPVLLDRCAIPDFAIRSGETLQDIQWVSLHQDWDAGVTRLLRTIRHRPDVAGEWTGRTGDVSLAQRGDQVTGNFTWQGWQGKLTGRLVGDRLVFEWISVGSRAEGLGYWTKSGRALRGWYWNRSDYEDSLTFDVLLSDPHVLDDRPKSAVNEWVLTRKSAPATDE